ncbi:hypothetical protein ACH492_22115 [Streptomyces sp. NPDC019443]|uniref:hypothetical protein n=1 Tax=Streptomyces sp. NPDC019443 TaxID=3365061 RepID=UPI0037B9ED51
MADDVNITVRVRDATAAGITAVNRSMNRLAAAADSTDKSFGGWKSSALSLAPALLPIAAATVPIAAGLGAATVAVGAFGAAIGPQVMAMAEASEAEKKYTDAVEQHGRSSKEAAEAEVAYLESVRKLPPATRTAAAGLSVLKDQYKDWSNSLADDTMPVATKSFALFGALFPKLTPLVKGASGQLDRFMNIAAGGIQSKGFDKFMASFADFAEKSLMKANTGLVKFTQALDAGKVGGGVSEFMQYARENGPLVGDTLQNLARALTKLVIAASDVGVGMLQVVNAFAKLVASMPTELITTLLQVAIAFKAVRLASAGMAVVGAHLARAGLAATAFGRAAMFGGVAPAIRGVAASMSMLQKASIGLAVLAVAAMAINELADKAKGAPPDVDKLTTSLKNLSTAGKFTGELRATFGDMDGFVAKVQKMRTESDALDKGRQWTSLTGLGPIAEKAAKKIDELARGTKSLSASKEDFKAFDESFASMATSGHASLAASEFKKFETALRATGMSTKEITAIFPEYTAAVASVKAEQEIAARGMGLFGEQALSVQAKLNAQKQSADGLRQSIHALNEAYLIARGGVRGMEAAIDAASEAFKKNGKTLDNNTEKGRANNQALDDLAGATMKAVEAVRESGGSWETASGIYARGRGELIKSATQMGLTKEAAARLADQILKTPNKTAFLRGNMADLQAKLTHAKNQLSRVPDSRRAEIRARIAQLEAAIRKAKGEIASVRGKTVVITTVHRRLEESAQGPLFKATGGIIGAAGGGPRSRMTLVGEQGPELVDLAPGSTVRSNPDTRRMMADATGAGGTSVVEIRSSGSRVDDMLLEILRRAIRVRGGNVQIVIGGRTVG